MDGHFRAFSFVDRVSEIEPGRHIRGTYSIPSGIDAFAPALVAEAVGQLAAWAAMSAVSFSRRPVAGIAAGVELLSTVRPGQVLELTACLESVEADAVAYDGSALADGVPVIQLRQCVGPMLPIEQFDDPQMLRDRFALLCGKGAAPGAFGGVSPLRLESANCDDARTLRATLHVPPEASFFADHFPRSPVLPGSLLMHSNLELANALMTQVPRPSSGCRWSPKGISRLKLRDFVPPGETLEIEARLHDLSTELASVLVQTRKGGRSVGGAQVNFVLEESR